MINKIVKRFYYRLRANFTTEDPIKEGLVVGNNFKRMHDVILDPSHCWLIEIGDNVTMAPRVHVLAHDASTKHFLDYTKIGEVIIGNNVFIGADTVILPNVIIGDNVIIGANSTVSKNLPSNGVYAGSPAKFVCSLQSYLEKNKALLKTNAVFDEKYIITNNPSGELKQEMKDKLKNKIGFIK